MEQESIKKERQLTLKQENFCQEYVLTGNKTKAYKTAYNADRMKPSTINQRACVLSKQNNITARIDELQQEKLKRNRVSVDQLVLDLGEMVQFDVATMFDEDGNLKNIHDLPLTARKMISQIETFEEPIVNGKRKTSGKVNKIRLLSKMDVIEKLMKNLGGYEKDKPIIPPNQNQITIFNLPDNKR